MTALLNGLSHRVKLAAIAAGTLAALAAALPAGASAETRTGTDNSGNYYICVVNSPGSETCFYSDGRIRNISYGRGPLPR